MDGGRARTNEHVRGAWPRADVSLLMAAACKEHRIILILASHSISVDLIYTTICYSIA